MPSATSLDSPHKETKGKSKAIAVVLAVLLAHFTWLYTFRKDWPKFVGAIVLGYGGTALLGMHLTSADYPELRDLGGNPYRFAAATMTAILYIWAVLDRCLKPSDWYRRYPNA